MIASRFPFAVLLPLAAVVGSACAEPSFRNPGPGGAGTGGATSVEPAKPPVVCDLPLASGTGGSGGMGGQGGAGEMLERAPIVAPVGSPVAHFGHLRVEGAQLLSECGEPVQLKGVSSHWLNWENDGYALSLPGLQIMRDEWGLKVIRAAMGVEASSGYLTNKTKMLRQVETIIANAQALGVYVIVDFHTHHAEDYQTQAIEFFSDLSKRYGHLPNVLFEPYNEPLDVSWDTVLVPYHQAVLAAIRQNDPDEHENVVILGTPNWDQDVDDVIGHQVSGNNLMYTVHFYACSHSGSYLSRAQRAQSQGVPIFVTEWGATAADGGVHGTPACGTQANPWMSWMASTHVGWAAWKLDNCDWEHQQNGVEDTSCLFKVDAPVDGPWTDEDLNGHAAYVIEKLKQ